MFVAALEDSMIYQIDYESERILKAASHVYETFFRKMAEADSLSLMEIRNSLPIEDFLEGVLKSFN